MSTTNYEKRIGEILGTSLRSGKIHLTWSNSAEAKFHKSKINQMQKELRLVKKEITASLRAINSHHTTERTKIGKTFGAGLASGLFGKKLMGKVNAGSRDQARLQQIQARTPYENASRAIDSLILQLDGVKLQIDDWIIKSDAKL